MLGQGFAPQRSWSSCAAYCSRRLRRARGWPVGVRLPGPRACRPSPRSPQPLPGEAPSPLPRRQPRHPPTHRGVRAQPRKRNGRFSRRRRAGAAIRSCVDSLRGLPLAALKMTSFRIALLSFGHKMNILSNIRMHVIPWKAAPKIIGKMGKRLARRFPNLLIFLGGPGGALGRRWPHNCGWSTTKSTYVGRVGPQKAREGI